METRFIDFGNIYIYTHTRTHTYIHTVFTQFFLKLILKIRNNFILHVNHNILLMGTYNQFQYKQEHMGVFKVIEQLGHIKM